MRPSHLALLVFVLVGLVAASSAANGGFIATLGSAEQAAAGLVRLTAEQQSTLNTLVAREVSLARQGGVSGFAGSFSSRRPDAERSAAGLDRLSDAELAALDRLVAQALAAAPVPVTTVRRMRAEEFERRKRFETHGEISFVYGRGAGGRSLVGGSLYTETYDRETGVTIGVGLSRYDGQGVWWPDYDYFYDYERDPLSAFEPFDFVGYPRPSGHRRR